MLICVNLRSSAFILGSSWALLRPTAAYRGGWPARARNFLVLFLMYFVFDFYCLLFVVLFFVVCVFELLCFCSFAFLLLCCVLLCMRVFLFCVLLMLFRFIIFCVVVGCLCV